MHISADLLIRLANEAIAKRLRQPNDIVAIYLTGSVLKEDSLIGGTTDIDLVMVHKEIPETEREIQRISYEISLDIQHHHQSFYAYPRRLRLNPWLGYALTNHNSILYDSNHWLEFIQAGVSSQFLSPETLYDRARFFGEKTRTDWFELEDPQARTFSAWMKGYFQTISTVANAVACLSGPALTTRRFMLDFPARAAAIEHLSLTGDLARLIGNEAMSDEVYAEWRPAWEQALISAGKTPNCPADLFPARKAYYLNCCDALVEANASHAALWPLLQTWQQAADVLANNPAQQETWISFLAVLGFSEANQEKALVQLDQFIDQSELVLAEWKNRYNL